MDFLQACAENIITENNNKGRGKKLITLILREIGKKKCFQYKVKNIKKEKGDLFSVYDSANNKSKVCRIVKILDKKKKRTQKTKVAEGVVFSEFAMHPMNWEVPEHIKEWSKIVGEKPNVVLCYHKRAGKDFMNEYLRDHLARVAKCKERSLLMHLINDREELKEFHKRPYFKTIIEDVKGNPRGKEDLKKIKFPCYCSYIYCLKNRLGVIDRIFRPSMDGFRYVLSNREKQYVGVSVIAERESLELLMRDWKIEILKGELKLWREVDKKGESKKKEQ